MKKDSFYRKHPYGAAISSALLCTFITVLGSALPQILVLPERWQMAVTSAFLALSALIGLIILYQLKTSLGKCGFCSFSKTAAKKVWWFVPLLLVETVPVILYGFQADMRYIDYLLLFLFTVCVGFNEEIYFRGIVLSILQVKGIKAAVAGSSIIFGILHLVNIFNGKNILYLILQMLFAFLNGIVLAEIVCITKSLWMVIGWHAMHNFISMSAGDALDAKELILLAVQVGILLIYALGIRKYLTEDRPNSTTLPC